MDGRTIDLSISNFDLIFDVLSRDCSKPNIPKDNNNDIYVTNIENNP